MCLIHFDDACAFRWRGYTLGAGVERHRFGSRSSIHLWGATLGCDSREPPMFVAAVHSLVGTRWGATFSAARVRPPTQEAAVHALVVTTRRGATLWWATVGPTIWEAAVHSPVGGSRCGTTYTLGGYSQVPKLWEEGVLSPD